jgi:hypothetical protein
MKNIKAFYYKDLLYIRLVPAKSLFNSTLVHQVVNRGDVFAMRVSDQQFTIVPGKAEVIHTEIPVPTEFPERLEGSQIDMFTKEVAQG